MGEMRGLIAEDVHGALDDMELLSEGSRCRQFLYHVSINPNRTMNAEEWQQAWRAYEEEYNLVDYPFVTVTHHKQGRTHQHRVYLRVDFETNKAIKLSFTKVRNEKVARLLEYELGHELTVGKHNQAIIERLQQEGRGEIAHWLEQHQAHTQERPVATKNHTDHQQEKRTGIRVEQVKTDLKEAYQNTDNGHSFEAAIAAKGYILAKGDRRDFVIVDREGGIHSPRRRIGVKAKELREKWADLNPDHLPTVEQVHLGQNERNIEQTIARKVRGKKPEEALALLEADLSVINHQISVTRLDDAVRGDAVTRGESVTGYRLPIASGEDEEDGEGGAVADGSSVVWSVEEGKDGSTFTSENDLEKKPISEADDENESEEASEQREGSKGEHVSLIKKSISEADDENESSETQTTELTDTDAQEGESTGSENNTKTSTDTSSKNSGIRTPSGKSLLQIIDDFSDEDIRATLAEMDEDEINSLERYLDQISSLETTLDDDPLLPYQKVTNEVLEAKKTPLENKNNTESKEDQRTLIKQQKSQPSPLESERSRPFRQPHKQHRARGHINSPDFLTMTGNEATKEIQRRLDLARKVVANDNVPPPSVSAPSRAYAWELGRYLSRTRGFDFSHAGGQGAEGRGDSRQGSMVTDQEVSFGNESPVTLPSMEAAQGYPSAKNSPPLPSPCPPAKKTDPIPNSTQYYRRADRWIAERLVKRGYSKRQIRRALFYGSPELLQQQPGMRRRYVYRLVERVTKRHQQKQQKLEQRQAHKRQERIKSQTKIHKTKSPMAAPAKEKQASQRQKSAPRQNQEKTPNRSQQISRAYQALNSPDYPNYRGTAVREYRKDLARKHQTHGQKIAEGKLGIATDQDIAIRLYGAGFSKEQVRSALTQASPQLAEKSDHEKQTYLSQNIDPKLNHPKVRHIQQEMWNWRREQGRTYERRLDKQGLATEVEVKHHQEKEKEKQKEKEPEIER